MENPEAIKTNNIYSQRVDSLGTRDKAHKIINKSKRILSGYQGESLSPWLYSSQDPEITGYHRQLEPWESISVTQHQPNREILVSGARFKPG